MNTSTRLPLATTPEQAGTLLALQSTFSQVCNTLAPVVAQQRCWHRVTLHHLMYRQLRAQFPALGSQMICNAIYMVCKAGRLVYQSPDSPFNTSRIGIDERLPTIYFKPDCPVHFDSHTLSMKGGQLSIFTMGGRMRFALQLQPAQMLLFASRRVLEITLRQGEEGRHELLFVFETAADAVPPAPALRKASHAAPAATAATADARRAAPLAEPMRWPDYLSVESNIR